MATDPVLFRDLAYVFLAALVGGFLAWAFLAPLHSAVVAPGVLEPESGRKTVKHNEGGPIGAVLVQSGQEVEAGQTLFELS